MFTSQFSLGVRSISPGIRQNCSPLELAQTIPTHTQHSIIASSSSSHHHQQLYQNHSFYSRILVVFVSMLLLVSLCGDHQVQGAEAASASTIRVCYLPEDSVQGTLAAVHVLSAAEDIHNIMSSVLNISSSISGSSSSSLTSLSKCTVTPIWPTNDNGSNTSVNAVATSSDCVVEVKVLEVHGNTAPRDVVEAILDDELCAIIIGLPSKGSKLAAVTPAATQPWIAAPVTSPEGVLSKEYSDSVLYTWLNSIGLLEDSLGLAAGGWFKTMGWRTAHLVTLDGLDAPQLNSNSSSSFATTTSISSTTAGESDIYTGPYLNLGGISDNQAFASNFVSSHSEYGGSVASTTGVRIGALLRNSSSSYVSSASLSASLRTTFEASIRPAVQAIRATSSSSKLVLLGVGLSPSDVGSVASLCAISSTENSSSSSASTSSTSSPPLSCTISSITTAITAYYETWLDVLVSEKMNSEFILVFSPHFPSALLPPGALQVVGRTPADTYSDWWLSGAPCNAAATTTTTSPSTSTKMTSTPAERYLLTLNATNPEMAAVTELQNLTCAEMLSGGGPFQMALAVDSLVAAISAISLASFSGTVGDSMFSSMVNDSSVLLSTLRNNISAVHGFTGSSLGMVSGTGERRAQELRILHMPVLTTTTTPPPSSSSSAAAVSLFQSSQLASVGTSSSGTSDGPATVVYTVKLDMDELSNTTPLSGAADISTNGIVITRTANPIHWFANPAASSTPPTVDPPEASTSSSLEFVQLVAIIVMLVVVMMFVISAVVLTLYVRRNPHVVRSISTSFFSSQASTPVMLLTSLVADMIATAFISVVGHPTDPFSTRYETPYLIFFAVALFVVSLELSLWVWQKCSSRSAIRQLFASGGGVGAVVIALVTHSELSLPCLMFQNLPFAAMSSIGLFSGRPDSVQILPSFLIALLLIGYKGKRLWVLIRSISWITVCTDLCKPTAPEDEIVDEEDEEDGEEQEGENDGTGENGTGNGTTGSGTGGDAFDHGDDSASIASTALRRITGQFSAPTSDGGFRSPPIIGSGNQEDNPIQHQPHARLNLPPPIGSDAHISNSNHHQQNVSHGDHSEHNSGTSDNMSIASRRSKASSYGMSDTRTTSTSQQPGGSRTHGGRHRRRKFHTNEADTKSAWTAILINALFPIDVDDVGGFTPGVSDQGSSGDRPVSYNSPSKTQQQQQEQPDTVPLQHEQHANTASNFFASSVSTAGGAFGVGSGGGGGASTIGDFSNADQQLEDDASSFERLCVSRSVFATFLHRTDPVRYKELIHMSDAMCLDLRVKHDVLTSEMLSVLIPLMRLSATREDSQILWQLRHEHMLLAHKDAIRQEQAITAAAAALERKNSHSLSPPHRQRRSSSISPTTNTPSPAASLPLTSPGIVHGAALFMAVGLQGSSRWVLGQIGASFSEAAPWLSNNPDMRQHIHDTSSEQGINAALSAQDAQVAASATTTGTAGGGSVRPQRSPHSCHLAPQPTKQDEVVSSQTRVSPPLVGVDATPPPAVSFNPPSPTASSGAIADSMSALSGDAARPPPTAPSTRPSSAHVSFLAGDVSMNPMMGDSSMFSNSALGRAQMEEDAASRAGATLRPVTNANSNHARGEDSHGGEDPPEMQSWLIEEEEAFAAHLQREELRMLFEWKMKLCSFNQDAQKAQLDTAAAVVSLLSVPNSNANVPPHLLQQIQQQHHQLSVAGAITTAASSAFPSEGGGSSHPTMDRSMVAPLAPRPPSTQQEQQQPHPLPGSAASAAFFSPPSSQHFSPIGSSGVNSTTEVLPPTPHHVLLGFPLDLSISPAVIEAPDALDLVAFGKVSTALALLSYQWEALTAVSEERTPTVSEVAAAMIALEHAEGVLGTAGGDGLTDGVFLMGNTTSSRDLQHGDAETRAKATAKLLVRTMRVVLKNNRFRSFLLELKGVLANDNARVRRRRRKEAKRQLLRRLQAGAGTSGSDFFSALGVDSNATGTSHLYPLGHSINNANNYNAINAVSNKHSPPDAATTNNNNIPPTSTALAIDPNNNSNHVIFDTTKTHVGVSATLPSGLIPKENAPSSEVVSPRVREDTRGPSEKGASTTTAASTTSAVSTVNDEQKPSEKPIPPPPVPDSVPKYQPRKVRFDPFAPRKLDLDDATHQPVSHPVVVEPPTTVVPAKAPVEAAPNVVVVPPTSMKAQPSLSPKSGDQQPPPKRQLQRVLWQPPAAAAATPISRDPSPPPPNRNPGASSSATPQHSSMSSSRPAVAAVDPMSPLPSEGVHQQHRQHHPSQKPMPVPASALRGGGSSRFPHRGASSLRPTRDEGSSSQLPPARVGPTSRVVVHQSPLFSIADVTPTTTSPPPPSSTSEVGGTQRTSGSPPPINVARNPLAGRPSHSAERAGGDRSPSKNMLPLPGTRPSPPITRCATPRNSSPAQSHPSAPSH